MNDSLNSPEFNPPEETVDPGAEPDQNPQPSLTPAITPAQEPIVQRMSELGADGGTSRRRTFRHNLFLLLSLALAAFILTSWILVRVDAPFGMLATGPQEIVSAQLRALNRDQLRGAYDLFSARFREQVSFEAWHELVASHWPMFHSEVTRAGTPAPSGPGVTLEIHLRGADDRHYRARFTLIRTDGRWWIDDVHWAEDTGVRDFSRT